MNSSARLALGPLALKPYGRKIPAVFLICPDTSQDRMETSSGLVLL